MRMEYVSIYIIYVVANAKDSFWFHRTVLEGTNTMF